MVDNLGPRPPSEEVIRSTMKARLMDSRVTYVNISRRI